MTVYIKARIKTWISPVSQIMGTINYEIHRKYQLRKVSFIIVYVSINCWDCKFFLEKCVIKKETATLLYIVNMSVQMNASFNCSEEILTFVIFCKIFWGFPWFRQISITQFTVTTVKYIFPFIQNDCDVSILVCLVSPGSLKLS